MDISKVEMTPLCELAYKYGTDKCPQIKHGYTPYYYELFKDRRETVKKVFEMGIGNYPCMKFVDTVFDKNLNRTYHRGASLYMWRDFFPNAMIYGADNVPDTIFQEDRITTYLTDETKTDEIKKLIDQSGSDIDFFVDDGSHKLRHQIFLCQNMMPLLDKGVIYIIEDVAFPQHIIDALPDYNVEIPNILRRRHDDWLATIRHK